MNDLKYHHRRGVNKVRMRVASPVSTMKLTLGAIMLALVVGFALSIFCPDRFTGGLDTNLLVPVTPSMLLPLAISIALLSIGAPGVPGAGVIMMSMLMTQLGVPVESVALIIGIGPLVGMFINASNCLGDVVVTSAVAKSEGLIDQD